MKAILWIFYVKFLTKIPLGPTAARPAYGI